MNYSPPSQLRSKVLIVDDDQMLRDTYELLLGDTCDIVSSGCPKDAIEFISKGLPLNIVIVDFDLKNTLDGTDVALKVREYYPHIPIVMATGSQSNSERIATFIAISNTAVLTKPFSHQILERIIATGICTDHNTVL